MDDLLLLSPLQSEIQGVLQALGPGEPVAVPAPGRLWRYRRGAGTVLAGWTGMGGVGTGRLLATLAGGLPTRALHLGVAGALRPGWSAGDVLLVEQALTPGAAPQACPPDPTLLARLEAGGPLRRGTSLSVSRPANTPEEKQALARAYPEAVLVEMETWWAAEAARELGLPLLCLRAVVDRCDQALPDLGDAIDEAGNPRPLKFALRLARSPRTALELPWLGRAFGRARDRLTALALGAVG